MKRLIPASEEDNVLHLYWVMLTAIENQIGHKPQDHILDAELVRAGYTILNRIGYTKARPMWEK